MFPYRAKYTESETNIQNNDLLYKINQAHQNTFEHLETNQKFRKKEKENRNFILLFI